MPIVLRVVREKSTVMKGFAYVTKKEIIDIMNWASAFNVRYSAKSLKLLAETRKDKIYEIMQMQNEKEMAKESKGQESEIVKTKKLRTLIRNLFKFDDEGPEDKEEVEGMGFENSLPELHSSQFDMQKDQSHNDSSKMRSKMMPVEEEGDLSKSDKKPLESPQNNDSILPLDPNQSMLPPDAKKQDTEEKILHKRKKESLSKIDSTLRRRALLKVSIIFIIFILYAILNIIYIVMVHMYSLSASNQYNDIQMRRPLMSLISLMCLQAFFENDTHYLVSQPNMNIRFLPEYRNRLLGIEESILNFEKSGPSFIFPDYIKKLSVYNSPQFCNELKAASGIDNDCGSYDSGFFKNGLRASQFRFITFWQSLAQKFLKETQRGSQWILAGYRYNTEITGTSIL